PSIPPVSRRSTTGGTWPWCSPPATWPRGRWSTPSRWRCATNCPARGENSGRSAHRGPPNRSPTTRGGTARRRRDLLVQGQLRHADRFELEELPIERSLGLQRGDDRLRAPEPVPLARGTHRCVRD